MCEFVTATFPADADMAVMQAVAEGHKHGFTLLSNRSMQQQQPPGERLVCLTSGACDCGTVVGSCSPMTSEPAAVDSSELQKPRRKGWSEAKLARWSAQRRENSELRAHEAQLHRESRTGEAAEWVAFVLALLATNQTSQVSLLCHSYRGGLESERVSLTGTVHIRKAALNPQSILETERDVLYVFVN